MTRRRTILLADPDAAGTRRLAAALRARGHRVLTVRDGSKALEVSVMRVPDVVLYEVGCPLIDPRTFAEILRANPRTAGIPVVVVGPDEGAERARGGFRDAFLQKPFNVDEVLARIEQLFRRAEAADEVRREGSLEGSLAEVSLPDLLQMLAMNRRSGTLHLEGHGDHMVPGGEGELILREGRVIDAKLEDISGEKALYRSIGWRRGRFSFDPGMPSGPGRIHLSMDEVLLEGMRQQDEIHALEDRAPRRDDVLALAVDLTNLPEGLHPVTEEILGLLELFRTAGEAVDNARATDLEALRAVTTLVDRGLVRILGRAAGDGGGKRLVASDVAYALHGRQNGHSAGRRTTTLRLVVGASEPAELKRLVTDLAEFEGFRPSHSSGALETGLGELGVLRLTEALEVLLVALPTADLLSPLWRPFGADAVGGVVLCADDDGGRVTGLVSHLAEAGRPVAVVGGTPAGLDGQGNLVVKASMPAEGVSKVLERVARSSRHPS